MRPFSGMDGGLGRSALPFVEQDFASLEEAEGVFYKLLRRAGVQPDWTWEQTVRAVVKDPAYRAIRDPKDRKASFEKYVADVRAQEKDREKERQAKLRADYFAMLKSHPEIKYYTRWKTAESFIEGETVFRSAKSEDEARLLFNEYRAELLAKHREEETKSRETALNGLVHILECLDLEPWTRWSKGLSMIRENDRFKGEKHFKTLSRIDILKAFENHIKSLERNYNETRQKRKAVKAREERKNRDMFIALLKDLKAGGKIKPGTKWKDIHDLIEDDSRYVAMLGQAGSTPLDLFWDFIEDEERMLRSKRNDALDVIEVRLVYTSSNSIVNVVIGQSF